MQVVIDGLNWISGLGPMCMMPIIMFVIGVCLRQKMGVLLRSCLMTGVGFAGVNMTINFFIAQVAPAVQMMVQRWGLHTDIMDVGCRPEQPPPGPSPWRRSSCSWYWR